MGRYRTNQTFPVYYHSNKDYDQILQWGLQNCNMQFEACGDYAGGVEFRLLTEQTPLSNVIMPPRLCGLNTAMSPPATVIEEDPCEFNAIMANNSSVEQYNLYVQNQMNQFDIIYEERCLAAKERETFTVSYVPSEYHYTLYYYDQAGNLVKTVPPTGVNPNYNSTYLTNVHNYRKGTSGLRPTPPGHTLTTNYRYNTLGQVIAQHTPDAGQSAFCYDQLGRLVLSQNAKQAPGNKYSYTDYDDLGRITSVGEKAISGTVSQAQTQDKSWVDNLMTTPSEQTTVTVYEENYTPLCPSMMCQENLRNRVSYTYTKSLSLNANWDAATFYSYDIHGNVKELLQDYKLGAMNDHNNRWKKIEYNYDLISGKVNEVAYQRYASDAFFHRYEYDAENRLRKVFTSRDKLMWEEDATYRYYRHGPLARMELGDLKVQGLDYAYTIQGWLKGVNSTSVGDGSFDMGRDGKTGSLNSLVARDAFGFSLNYFAGDYKPVDAAGNSTQKPFLTQGLFDTYQHNNNTLNVELYNGNVSSMLVNIPKLVDVKLNRYKYDQLNRLTAMDGYDGLDNSTNGWTSTSPTLSLDYKERISYDPNGNIITYLRNGAVAASGLAMDNLGYKYDYYVGTTRYSYTPGQTALPANARVTNRLNHVEDDAGGTYTEDIKSQPVNNYDYDEIGNLTADNSEGINSIVWNVYGKIKSITKNNLSINYTYDASGNRISKAVTQAGTTKTTWYVRDASGNVMSTYEYNGTHNNGHLTQTEIHLYGSSRLGLLNTTTNVQDLIMGNDITTVERGNKNYELSNHLGNVLATVSDRKLQHDAGNGTVDYYEADVLTANDYYPGGMMMPGRTYHGDVYCYAFGGKRKENELYGEGKAYDFGARIYDVRTVRWLSLDPLQKKYPALSPYNFCENNPIYFNDPDGQDAIARIVTDAKGNKTMIISATYHYVAGRISENVKKLVHGEFEKNGNRKGIVYQGEKINVKFEISFVEHNTTDADIKGNYYVPLTGDNDFTSADYGTNKYGDLSNGRVVTVNTGLYLQKVAYKGSEETIPTNVADEEVANFVVHGIGHNIGMTHGEKGEGVMDRTVGTMNFREETDISGTKSLKWDFSWDRISKDNVQNLVNRIDDMTAAKDKYWEGKEIDNKQEKKNKDGDYPKEKLDATGVTTVKP